MGCFYFSGARAVLESDLMVAALFKFFILKKDLKE